jgi:hypothetical protein
MLGNKKKKQKKKKNNPKMIYNFASDHDIILANFVT